LINSKYNESKERSGFKVNLEIVIAVGLAMILIGVFRLKHRH